MQNFQQDHLGALEREMSLPPGFLEALKREDDWSFVIKGHAFLEGVLTHILVHAVAREELRDVFAGIDTSDTRGGKIAFATALGLLDRADRRFLVKFSELRNTLVHDVTRVTFSFNDYIASMNEEQFASFATTFSLLSAGQDFVVGDQTINVQQFARQLPKLAVWNSLAFFAAKVYPKRHIALFQTFLQALERDAMRRGMDGSAS